MFDRTKLNGNIGARQTATLYTYKTDEDWATVEAYDLKGAIRVGGMMYIYSTLTKTGRIYFVDGVHGDESTFYLKKAYGA